MLSSVLNRWSSPQEQLIAVVCHDSDATAILMSSLFSLRHSARMRLGTSSADLAMTGSQQRPKEANQNVTKQCFCPFWSKMLDNLPVARICVR